MSSNTEQQVIPQPDIFTYNVTTLWRPSCRFLQLPREIRDNIYSFVVESEQEDQREYAGINNTTSKSELCTPLLKIRPPSLVRVCKATRDEYLPYYFRETCFRVYVNICKPIYPWSHEQISGRTPHKASCLCLDEPTRLWLDSIAYSDKIVFRKLQFRLVSHDEMAIGAGVNIAFNTRAGKYDYAFTIDDGWDVGLTIEQLRLPVFCVPRYMWRMRKEMNARAERELLDWENVKIMTHEFDPTYMFAKEPYIVLPISRNSIVEWGDETCRME